MVIVVALIQLSVRLPCQDSCSWSSLGSGVTGGALPIFTYVDALTVFDDGTGPALYAGAGTLRPAASPPTTLPSGTGRRCTPWVSTSAGSEFWS